MLEAKRAALNQNRSVIRGCYTDCGPQRDENEDACALPPAGADEERRGTALAAGDGVGGRAGGAAASRDAVNYLQAFFYAEGGSERHGARLQESVEAVNALNRFTQKRLGEVGTRLTTLVAAVVYRDRIWIANVGDSRAYLVRASNGEFRQLTEDHSQHNQRIKAGLGDDSDEQSERDGIITRAIGWDDDLQVDLYRCQWAPGDRLILCTDGLASLLPEVMAEIVLNHPPQEAAEALVLRANEEDGSDNSTAIVAAWQYPATTLASQVDLPPAPVSPSKSRPLYFVGSFVLGVLSTAILFVSVTMYFKNIIIILIGIIQLYFMFK